MKTIKAELQSRTDWNRLISKTKIGISYRRLQSSAQTLEHSQVFLGIRWKFRRVWNVRPSFTNKYWGQNSPNSKRLFAQCGQCLPTEIGSWIECRKYAEGITSCSILVPDVPEHIRQYRIQDYLKHIYLQLFTGFFWGYGATGYPWSGVTWAECLKYSTMDGCRS